MEGDAPKGWRLDGDGGVKKSEGDRLKSTINESTLSTADAVPLPQWGRLRNESNAILETQPSLMGNAIKLSGRTFLAPHRGSSPKG